MPTNNRVFWAVQAVGVAKESTRNFTVIHGLQSVGLTTNFNLDRIFEIGQISIYENVEDIPDIEMTLEKVIDGYPLIYHLATFGATSATLAGRSTRKCNVALAVFSDVQDSASGLPQSQVELSGMYVSSLNYTFPVEGNCTESVTLVGNNKLWKSSNFTFPGNTGTLLNNADTPLALSSGLGGIQRRENVIFGGSSDTILPGGTNGIPGISSSGTNNKTADVFGAHIQTITVSTNLGRTALNELGRRTPYFRYVEFPVDVTCDIEVTSSVGDEISATEEGVAGSGNNLTESRIRIKLQDTTTLDLGTKNKLSSVSYGGGDAGGGNATCTYSYLTSNDLTVTHAQDPSGL
jgi:hypothetical protein